MSKPCPPNKAVHQHHKPGSLRFCQEEQQHVHLPPSFEDTGSEGTPVSELRGNAGGVLVGCEYSATVRDALRARGIDAISCDILPTEGDSRWHIQGCVRDAIRSRRWAGVILHIPCTKMAVCGNTTYAAGKPLHHERTEAIDWSCETVELALEYSDCVAVENPASVIFPYLRAMGADVQYIQPWQHGHPEQKKTGLALWGLPRLKPTHVVYEQMMRLPRKERERIFFMSPGKNRGLERSRFYPGFANAFATQWGVYLQSLHHPRHGGTNADRSNAGGDDLSFHSQTNSPEAQRNHG